MTDRRPDVSVVVVTHNVRDLARQCLASIDREEARGSSVIEVLVVDSASTDGTPTLAAEFPRFRFICSARNLGYTGGNNWGIRIARGRHVLLLNPDTELGAGAIDSLARHLDENPDVAAVGPRLRWPDGSVQPSRRRFPLALTGFVESTVLQRWFGGSQLLRRYYLEDRPSDQTHDVEWLVGAALMVRADVLRAVGLFDERFFMYSEEVDLCRRIQAAGWRIVFLSDADVVHHEGKSSEQDVTRRDLRFHESRALYYAKHHGAALALALRAFTIVNFIWLLLEESAKLVLRPSTSDLRRTRLRSHRTVIAAQSRRLLAHALGRS